MTASNIAGRASTQSGGGGLTATQTGPATVTSAAAAEK